MSAACERLRERFPEAAANRQGLDPELRAHLDACASCRRELDDLSAILAADASEMPEPLPETDAPRLVREDLCALAVLRRRAPLLVVVAVALVAVSALLIAKRRDLAELPIAFLVGSIALLAIVGATGIFLSTRLSGLSRRLAATFVVVGSALFVAVSFLMPSGPSSEAPAGPFDCMVPCLLVTAVHAVLPVGLAVYFALRARFFSAASAVTVGVGAGLLAQPVMEMFCPISATSHLLVAHGGGIVAATFLSLAIFAVLQKRRLPQH